MKENKLEIPAPDLELKLIESKKASHKLENILKQTVRDALKMIEEAKVSRTKEIKDYIETLPTDGWDRWHFYNKEIGKLIEEKYLKEVK